MDQPLVDYLYSCSLRFKERGAEVVLEYCPYCEAGEKGNFSHFYFSKDKEVFLCHKCGATGNLYKFKLDRGDIRPVQKAREIRYKRPVENATLTAAKETFWQWYEKERGIRADIAQVYQVGSQDSNGSTVIVYQYFDQSGALFNRKYRTPDKKFWTEKEAEKGFYGMQFVDVSQSELMVVEGEDDCHAMVQYGFTNVVSVPYGAGNYTPAMDEYLKQFATIYLVFDADERGQEGAYAFAEKAGMPKCWNVILPFKDARQCLREGVAETEIRALKKGAGQFRHSKIIRPVDLRAGFKQYVSERRKSLGYQLPDLALNEIMGGVRINEMTVLTGHTGRGKSTFALNVALWAEQSGMCSMILSFENTLNNILRKLIEIQSGESLFYIDRMMGETRSSRSELWIDEQINKLNERALYFLNREKGGQGYCDLQKLLDTMAYANKFYDVNFFLIDHLHYFLKLSAERNAVYVIDEAVRALAKAAENMESHILLIVHPHMVHDKDGRLVRLGLNSLRGSQAIAQESSNFWVISRKIDADGNVENLSRLEVLKNREFGRIGQIDFDVSDNGNTFGIGRLVINKH